jgi:hypothetical protein
MLMPGLQNNCLHLPKMRLTGNCGMSAHTLTFQQIKKLAKKPFDSKYPSLSTWRTVDCSTVSVSISEQRDPSCQGGDEECGGGTSFQFIFIDKKLTCVVFQQSACPFVSIAVNDQPKRELGEILRNIDRWRGAGLMWCPYINGSAVATVSVRSLTSASPKLRISTRCS